MPKPQKHNPAQTSKVSVNLPAALVERLKREGRRQSYLRDRDINFPEVCRDAIERGLSVLEKSVDKPRRGRPTKAEAEAEATDDGDEEDELCRRRSPSPEQIRQRAEEVQQRWSERKEVKANCYHRPPVTYQPIGYAWLNSDYEPHD